MIVAIRAFGSDVDFIIGIGETAEKAFAALVEGSNSDLNLNPNTVSFYQTNQVPSGLISRCWDGSTDEFNPGVIR